jgi:MFS family permease
VAEAGAVEDARRPEPTGGWLFAFCLSRVGFGFIFTTYSGALSLLRLDWHMTAGEAGLIQSAWHIGYLISLFTVGFLADRFGARRVYVRTGIAASVSALAFAVFADSFWSGFLLYGLTGLCSGGSYTPGLAILSQRYAAKGRGRAMGYYLAASSLGYAVSLALTSALLPYLGWRGAFLVTACGPAVGTLMSFWVLRDTPNVIAPAAAEPARGGSLVAVIRNRPAMLAMTAYMFHSWELLGMWAWMPAYLAAAAAHGGSVTARSVSLGAIFSALTYLTSMGGSIAGGTLSDRFGRTAVILWMSLGSLACSFAFGWMVGLPLWLLVAMGIVYNFTAIGDSAVYSTALTELVPPRLVGAAYSLRSVMGFGMGAVSPWVFGLMLDWGRSGGAPSERLAWGMAWSSLAAGALLGPLMTLRLRRLPESAHLAGGRR